MSAGADWIGKAFVAVLDERIAEERREKEAVRAEIGQQGAWWAADEIWRLRRELARHKRAALALAERADRERNG